MREEIISGVDGSLLAVVDVEEDPTTPHHFRGTVVEDHWPAELRDALDTFWELVENVVLALLDDVEETIHSGFDPMIRRSRQRIFQIELVDPHGITFFDGYPTAQGMLPDRPHR